MWKRDTLNTLSDNRARLFSSREELNSISILISQWRKEHH